MGLFRFYFHQGKLITPSVCETEAGFLVDQGPLTVTSVKDSGKVRQAIIKAFIKGNLQIPTPDGTEAAGSIILERLVIDSWSKFEKDAVLYTVHTGGRYTTLHVTGRGDDGIRDRLTDFSRPVTGAFYFAPSLDALNDLLG